MKNLKHSITLIALILCGITVQAQNKQQLTPEQQANKIIGFTNTIVDVSNEAFKRLKEYKTVFEKADANMTRIKNGKYDKKFPFSTFFYVNRISAGYIATYEEAEKKAVASPEKSELAKMMAAARKSVVDLDSACAHLERYIIKFQFEGDKNFARYNILLDSATTAWQNSRAAWRTLANKTAEVSDKAEAVILKKTKGASVIIPMKADISALDRAIDELYDLAEYEKMPAERVAALKNSAADLQASLEKNKNVQGKTALLQNKEDDYKAFYEHTENCLKHLILLLDELNKPKPDNSTINSESRKLNDERRNAIEFYNYLIDVIK